MSVSITTRSRNTARVINHEKNPCVHRDSCANLTHCKPGVLREAGEKKHAEIGECKIQQSFKVYFTWTNLQSRDMPTTPFTLHPKSKQTQFLLNIDVFDVDCNRQKQPTHYQKITIKPLYNTIISTTLCKKELNLLVNKRL